MEREEEEEDEEDNEEEEGSCLPTIYFSHTVEPKKVRLGPKNWTQAFVSAFNPSIFASFLPLQVRINTGKNTTLKFSERKEQKEHSKKKKKNGHANGHAHGHSHGHAHHDFHKITTPADIYR